jgi:hypothetical protein
MVMTGDRAAKILAAVAMASCCSLEACKGCGKHESNSSEGRPSLAGVSVSPIAPALFKGAQIHLDKVELAARVKGVLEGEGVFSPPAPLRPAAQVSLESEVSTSGTADAPEIVAKVRLRIAVRPASGGATRFNEDVAAVGQAPLAAEGAEQARAVFQRLVERIAGDLLLAYAGRLKLWEADVRGIASALHSADNELRVEALHVIGARQLREQIPTVLQLLSDEDEGVRDAALGALVALRERSAVKTLAESRQMRDTREMRKILDAIASLGGSEARDYLSFVAETHDDEEIRAMATEALERLLRHPRPDQTTK